MAATEEATLARGTTEAVLEPPLLEPPLFAASNQALASREKSEKNRRNRQQNTTTRTQQQEHAKKRASCGEACTHVFFGVGVPLSRHFCDRGLICATSR